MLPAFNGRINRKTYIIGNLLALGILFVACAFIAIPVAILDLALTSKTADAVLGVLYYTVIFPALLYYFYFVVLMVKRAHDLGWPGLLLAFGFTVAEVISHAFDINQLNILALLLLLFFCSMPGKKHRNNFGPAPRKNFRPEDLKVTF